jgi:uncharacterized protein
MEKLSIKDYSFDQNGRELVGKLGHGKDWPIVYLIHNKKEMYVGETQNAFDRFQQHLANPERNMFDTIEIIDYGKFNTSAILDIEQQLIQLVNCDGLYTLKNKNGGQSIKHNYYQRDFYHTDVLSSIWDSMKKKNLAKKDLNILRNLDIFKYSPFISLTDEQNDICRKIIEDMRNIFDDKNGKTGTFLVNGGAGTGKTVMALVLMKQILDLIHNKFDSTETEDLGSDRSLYNYQLSYLKDVFQKNNIKKIGFVLPMESFRKNIYRMFKDATGYSPKGIILSSGDVIGNDYDIVFVDESHRLSARKNLTAYGDFDTKSRILGLDPKKTNQLEWVQKSCRYSVLFYDKCQTVKKSDIPTEEFKRCATTLHDSIKEATISCQMRCMGGGKYIDYIDSIFNCENIEKEEFNNYELLMYDNAKEMLDDINKKNKVVGLSSVCAGYDWPWITHKESQEEIKLKDDYDFILDGQKFVWNTKNYEKNRLDNEIGSVHTTQGRDLNYNGVILGPDIYYDKSRNCISIRKANFYDKKVKADTTYNELHQFIINSYLVMLKRGIYGTYLYVCDKDLKEYLSKYITNKKDF